MYAVTSKPLDSLTRATFLKAEFGFFGVVVYTFTQTPLLSGYFSSAGTLFLVICFTLFFFNNWLIVGIKF